MFISKINILVGASNVVRTKLVSREAKKWIRCSYFSWGVRPVGERNLKQSALWYESNIQKIYWSHRLQAKILEDKSLSEISKDGRSSSDLEKAFEAKAGYYVLGEWQMVQHGCKARIKAACRGEARLEAPVFWGLEVTADTRASQWALNPKCMVGM